MGIGGFTLYTSPKIIGEREVARYTGGSVLGVLHFTVHRK